MKNKLFSPARKESGFTLIELLTVIVIIGILAAIAIPIFASQKARAQDSQTVSDVRNAAIAAESFLVDKNNKFSDLSKASIEFSSSKNVSWEIKGDNAIGGYCIAAKNTAGKKYATDATALTYDSLAGGVGKKDGACTTANTPVPSGPTNVGSSTSYGAVTFNASGTGRNGTTQTFSVSDTGTYKIEAWGAQGGAPSGNTAGLGAYAAGTVKLNAGQALAVRVGQAGMGTDLAGYNDNGSGGGGSFVVFNNTTPVVVAGGGGGLSILADQTGVTAPVSTTNGQTSTAGGAGGGYQGASGGTNGSGGAYTGGYGGGGGGFTGDGASNNGLGGGLSYANGSTGGNADGTNRAAYGGFGGGGGVYAANCYAGGGGGYSGGGGAHHCNSWGGGGGSFVASTFNGETVTANETNNTTKANTGQGKVVITRIS
jgi:prepilin-type N-terminal cleavage/methylation domain-containing protein